MIEIFKTKPVRATLAILTMLLLIALVYHYFLLIAAACLFFIQIPLIISLMDPGRREREYKADLDDIAFKNFHLGSSDYCRIKVPGPVEDSGGITKIGISIEDRGGFIRTD